MGKGRDMGEGEGSSGGGGAGPQQRTPREPLKEVPKGPLAKEPGAGNTCHQLPSL